MADRRFRLPSRPSDATRWKSPKLADVIVYDPFALPAAFPRPQMVAGSAASRERTD